MQDAPVLLTMILMGAVVVAVLWRRGYLRADAFDASPPRVHGMVPEDLLVGIAVLALSQLAALIVLHLLGFEPFAEQKTFDPGPVGRSLQLLIMQIVGALPVVLFTLFESRRRTQQGWKGIGLTRIHPRRDLFVGLTGFIAAIWVCFAVGAIVSLIVKMFQREVPDIGHRVLQEMFNSDSATAVAIMSVSAIVVAPLLEEIIYRGLVQSGLMAWFGPQHRWSIVLLGAAIFAFVHAAVADPLTLPTLFVLGVFLGWMYERTGSLWPGIIVHAGFNLVNIGVVLMVMGEAMTSG